MTRDRQPYDPGRSARRALSRREAEAFLQDLRRGRTHTVEHVEFPPDFSVDVPRLHDVEFTDSKLWLTVDGGWFGRAAMARCRFVNCHLDALRVRKADLSSVSFERVVFGGRSIGGFHDARIQGMRLIDCRLRDHSFSESSLDGLEVVGGSMRDMNFMDCQVTSARFATELDQMNLVRCSFDDADMSACTVGDVAIIDWRASDLVLPKSAGAFLVVPATARGALDPVLRELSMAVRERLIDGPIWSDLPALLLSERSVRTQLKATPAETDLLVGALLSVAPTSLHDVANPGDTAAR